MKNPLISVIIITYRRKKEIFKALSSVLSQNFKNFELILIDNNEKKDFSQFLKKFTKGDKRIRYFSPSGNLGVSGGRNLGIRMSKGKILIFLDDDAYFEKKDDFSQIVKKFFKDPNLGIIAFKILDPQTGKIRSDEFPSRNKKLNFEKEFETSYFVGAGWAARKIVFKKVGLFPDFFYGMEELDLSFKAIDKGFRIIYFPKITVFHQRLPLRELSFEKRWENLLINRIKVAIFNLPLRYLFLNTFFWTLLVFLKTRGNLKIIFKSFESLIKEKNKLFLQRKVIGPKTIEKIKKLKGHRLIF